MKRFKFGNQKLYVIPGTNHRFRTEHDAKFYCDEHGIDFADVEKYDSKKEYERWLVLQQDEKDGKISCLDRQVEFEIIPAHYEDVVVRYKDVKHYIVDERSYRLRFDTKEKAKKFASSRGLPHKYISCETTSEPVTKHMCIEKSAVYTADFVYRDSEQHLIVEDVKSDITRKEADYVLRRKLMLHVHGIRIKET